MKPRHWWAAAALAMLVGCGESDVNPNEIDFPGAPGSRVPAPPTPPKEQGGGGGGGGMASGDGSGLPSSYPGIEKVRADKKAADASPDSGKEAPPAKPEAPKPDAPASTDAPKIEAPKVEAPRVEAPKPEAPK